MPEKKSADLNHIIKQGYLETHMFHVVTDEELKKSQAILLQMTKDLIQVMDKHDLAYSLSGGTVLGAVRHHGFIPWDDDVDINMPRESYNRLIKIFESELGEQYEFMEPGTVKNYGIALPHVQKKETIRRPIELLSVANCGLSLDIFVVENAPDNAFLRAVHGFICLTTGYLLSCRRIWNDWDSLKIYIGNSKPLRTAYRTRVMIGRLISWFSLEALAALTIKIYSLCRNTSSKYVTIPSGRKHYFGEIMLRSDLEETITVPFENICMKIPKGFDPYLKNLFGCDYMKVPPKEAREQHPLVALDLEKCKYLEKGV